MDAISYKIAQSLGLSFVPTEVDYIGAVGILVLTVVSIYNFVANDEKANKSEGTAKVEPEKEKNQEEKIEAHAPTEVVTEKVVETAPVAAPVMVEQPKLSWDKRLFKGLSKTRSEIWGRVGSIISGKKIDDDVIEELEEVLFTSDLSPVLVDELLESLKDIPEVNENTDYLSHIKDFMKSKMNSAQEKVNAELYDFDPSAEYRGPKVIMIVGVNGAGKTTTIGKLATKLKRQGAKVVVGACDTFRAAAVEQLEVWCNRAEVEIVKAGEGADPSGVAFDTVAKAKELKADYCIVDTAGRLHTKSNLMDELTKTKKVMSKVIPEAPHETLLVVDAITGQNALRQAEEFNKALELSGLIFTKCDGSSKAGSAVGIVQTLNVPITYIGVGEDVEDLNIFDLDNFLDALLGIEA